MIRITRDLITEVKSMMERNWDALDIARKMGLDIDDVRMIMDIVNNLFT